MKILENLEPQAVFKYFEEISRIPHGSGNEKALSDYILKTAKKFGFEAVQDEANNIVIRFPASEGYENAPTVILQGHMDMVCEKNGDVEFDFESEPLKLVLDGDFIRAEGTTLGGDNAIAVAYALALMERGSFERPEIEFVLTTGEETGMEGAKALDAGLLKGRIFINLDSEDEGIFLTSCAGGLKLDLTIKANLVDVPEGYAPICVAVSGLKGGHSGTDINKNRANANRVLGRVLCDISDRRDVYLKEINGGLKDNAIPREASAIIFVKKNDMDQIREETAAFEKILKLEYGTSDPGLRLEAKAAECSGFVFEKDALTKVSDALLLIPCGVAAMSADMEGLPESSNNIGVVFTDGGAICLHNAVRSSVESGKQLLARQIRRVAALVGAECTERDDYPGWKYDRDSKIRPLVLERYRKFYGGEPKLEAIHAGLECGVFAGKLPGLDSISFGPNVYDPHTPDERMSASSAARTWDFLLKILKGITDSY